MPIRYIPRKISTIQNNDSRVSVIGSVASVGKNSFILDDGESRAEIIFEGSLERNKTARVYCTISENKLKADIVQQLGNFDINLFKKVEELYNKVL